jgi:hypothetical protein
MMQDYESVPVHESINRAPNGIKKKVVKQLSHEKIRQKYGLTTIELNYLQGSFSKIAKGDQMTVDDWASAMGVRGIPRASHLAIQIFKNMGEDRDGVVNYYLISGLP